MEKKISLEKQKDKPTKSTFVEKTHKSTNKPLLLQSSEQISYLSPQEKLRRQASNSSYALQVVNFERFCEERCTDEDDPDTNDEDDSDQDSIESADIMEEISDDEEQWEEY